MFEIDHDLNNSVQHMIDGAHVTTKEEVVQETSELIDWNDPFDDDVEEEDSEDDFTPLTEKLKRQQEEKAQKAKDKIMKDVLVLTTSKDNRLICIEGYFYRLDAKSLQSNTLRWKCFRCKDLDCTGRIYTESLENDQQRFKPMRLHENVHNHKPYSEQQLHVLIKRNKMRIIQGREELLQSIGSSPIVPAKVQSISLAMDPMATHIGKIKRKKIISVSGERNHREISVKKFADSEEDNKFLVKDEGSTADRQSFKQFNALNMELPMLIDAKPSQLSNQMTASSSGIKTAAINTQFMNNPDNIDPTNVLVLRSAKGRELLCLDGFIYHSKPYTSAKSIYWVCIKSKMANCHARATTSLNENNAIKVTRISNAHTHPVSEYDIKKRLFNEFAKNAEDKKKFKNLDIMQKPLSELNPQLAILLAKRMGTNPLTATDNATGVSADR